jgi:hypothetical protein
MAGRDSTAARALVKARTFCDVVLDDAGNEIYVNISMRFKIKSVPFLHFLLISYLFSFLPSTKEWLV